MNKTEKIVMPDEIMEIAKDMAETQKIRDKMKMPNIVSSELPKDEQTYNTIF